MDYGYLKGYTVNERELTRQALVQKREEVLARISQKGWAWTPADSAILDFLDEWLRSLDTLSP